jgi:uncharacterized membrane protein YhaH (DUF805 family)
MTVIPTHLWLYNVVMLIVTAALLRQLHDIAKKPRWAAYLTPQVLSFTTAGTFIYLLCWGIPNLIIVLIQSIRGAV